MLYKKILGRTNILHKIKPKLALKELHLKDKFTELPLLKTACLNHMKIWLCLTNTAHFSRLSPGFAEGMLIIQVVLLKNPQSADLDRFTIELSQTGRAMSLLDKRVKLTFSR